MRFWKMPKTLNIKDKVYVILQNMPPKTNEWKIVKHITIYTLLRYMEGSISFWYCKIFYFVNAKTTLILETVLDTHFMRAVQSYKAFHPFYLKFRIHHLHHQQFNRHQQLMCAINGIKLPNNIIFKVFQYRRSLALTYTYT